LSFLSSSPLFDYPFVVRKNVHAKQIVEVKDQEYESIVANCRRTKVVLS